jgi:hypothetical protein
MGSSQVAQKSFLDENVSPCNLQLKNVLEFFYWQLQSLATVIKNFIAKIIAVKSADLEKYFLFVLLFQLSELEEKGKNTFVGSCVAL